MSEQSTENRMFHPRSVAVVGASPERSRISGMALSMLIEGRFAGEIVPVNPRYQEVAGLPAVSRISDYGKPIDVALLAIPSAAVVPALRECLDSGVQTAVVLASGFAETGAEGEAMQREVEDLSGPGRVRVLGPNCAGYISNPSKLRLTFGSHLSADSTVPSGSVATVCQSGAVGAYLLSRARQAGQGISHWITTGNESDLQVADFIEHLGSDPDTSTIAVYLEQIRDYRRFAEASDFAIRAGKNIVALKAGRSAAGQRAAQAHTAALATDSAVDSAFLKELGIHEVLSLDELRRTSWALASSARPRGTRVGIVTISGAAGVLMADACGQHGLEVPALPQGAQDRIRGHIPYAGTANPVDVTGNYSAAPEVWQAALTEVARSGEVDAIVAYLGHTVLMPSVGDVLIAATKQVALETGIPVWLVALPDDQRRGLYDDIMDVIPVFDDPTVAISSLASVVDPARPVGRTSAAIADRLTTNSSMPEATLCLVPDDDARKLVQPLNLPFVEEQLAPSALEAEEFARKLGRPCVVKIAAANLGHKAAAGGLAFDQTSATIGATFDALVSRVESAHPDAGVLGCFVQPQLRSMAEVIVGVRATPHAGLVITVGFGGSLVEAMNSSATGLVPVDEEVAEGLLRRSRVDRVLRGLRDEKPDQARRELLDLILAVSSFVQERRGEIASFELNPIMLTTEGEWRVVDLLIEEVRLDSA